MTRGRDNKSAFSNVMLPRRRPKVPLTTRGLSQYRQPDGAVRKIDGHREVAGGSPARGRARNERGRAGDAQGRECYRTVPHRMSSAQFPLPSAQSVEKTHRWREPNSNHRSRSCERLFWALPIGDGARKAEPLTGSGPKRQCLPGLAAHSLSPSRRDREFESVFLQRRVCKPSVSLCPDQRK
jgi:hypothetical protein